MAVVDNLGREIAGGIDQSSFIKQMADSLRTQDVAVTKTSEHAEEIASGSGKLPQEIADKIRAAFEDDITKAVSYLEVVKKFCEDKAKDKGGEKKEDGGDMIDAITVLGDKLLKHFSSGGADASGAAAGFVTANAHLAAIAGATQQTATSCVAMAAAFLHKGSGYTHDIHCEAILGAMQKDLRAIGASMGSGAPVVFDDSIGNIISDDFIKKVKAAGDPDMPTAKPSGGGAGGGGAGGAAGPAGATADALADIDVSTEDIISATGDLAKNYEYLLALSKRSAKVLSMQPHDIEKSVLAAKNLNVLSAEQVKYMNLGLQGLRGASFEQQKKVKLILQEMNATGVTTKNTLELADALAQVGKKTEEFGKTLRDPVQYLMDDIRMNATRIAKEFFHGAAGGVEMGQVVKGIWGEQVKHNAALHEALYVTQGLSAGLDSQRQQYMRLGREASAVAETGVDILTYQKAYLSNMKSGIKDAQTLSRVTRAGLGVAQATGMNAEQTAKSFGQWNTQLGMSSNQLSQVGRAVKFAAQATGLMGDELAGALQSAKELANEMRNAATLTSDAAGAFVQFTASAKKFGVEKSVTPLLKAMSSTVELYNNASAQTQALLFQAAGTMNRVGDLQNGTVMNSEEGRKDMGKGLENVLNSFLAKFGKDMSQIDKLSAQEKMQLNLQLQSAYGMQLGEFQKTVEAYKEGTKSVTDKINDINKQLQGNLTQQERQALLDQKRGMELQQLLGGLTKLDEAAKSAKTMAEALKTQNMTEDQLRKQLTDTITNVNGALSKAGKKGDMIDPKRIEAAMKDPAQYRELLAGINAAEQKSQVAAKAAADPVLGAQQKMNELQGKVVENTGKIAERMTSLLGPRGVIAMSLATMALNTQAGQAVLSNSINKLLAMRTARGAAGAAGAGGDVAGKVGSTLAGATGPGTSSVAGAVGSGAGKLAGAAGKGAGTLATAIPAIGTESAAAAPLLTRMGAGISSMGAALLPLIKIIAIAGIVIVGLIALFQGLQKAFENIGFDMSELTAIGQKVWGVIKKLWNGLTTLLGVALIPLAYAIKFLAKGISWLLDKINSLLDSIGLGGGSKASTAAPEDDSPADKAGAAGGAAAAGEAAGGGTLSTKKSQNAAVDAINTQPVKMVEKNLKDTNANLPDNKKIMGDIMSIFAWLAGFSVAIGLFALLATYFNLTAGQVIRVALVSGLALVALIAGVAILTYAMAMSFKLLSQSIDFLAATWESLSMWGQLGKFLGVAFEILAWVAVFTVAMAVWGVLGVVVGIAALVVGAVAIVVMLAFALVNLAVALLNVILAWSLMALVGSMNMLSETVKSAGMWSALGNYLGAMYELLAFTLALTAALLVWAVLGLVVGTAALIVGAVAGVVMLAFAVFNLVMALINAILTLSLMALVGSMNWLTDVVNNWDIWGALGNYLGAMYQLLAFIGALTGALLIWSIFGFFVGVAAIIVGAVAGVVMLAFALFNLVMSLMNVILTLSLMALVGSMNWLSETVNGLGIWGALGNYLSAMYQLLAWTAALTGALAIWAIFGFFVGVAAIIVGAVAGVVMLAFALFNLVMSLMNVILTLSLMAVVGSMNWLAETVESLGIWDALGNYLGAMYQLLGWTAALTGALAVWAILGFFIGVLAAIVGVASAVIALGFAMFLLGISWMSDMLTYSIQRVIWAFERLADAVSELPKMEDIWKTMLDLYSWIKQMQGLMAYLDWISTGLVQYGLWWYWVSTNFADRFNNALQGISNSFLKINPAGALMIEKHMDFVDKLPDGTELEARMIELFDWMTQMQKTMNRLDGLSDTLDQYGTWWWSAGQKFTDRFNNAIWGISRAFTGIDKGAILSIETHLGFIDDLPETSMVSEKMIGLYNWVRRMQAISGDLDKLSENVDQYGIWWRIFGQTFTGRFNNAMWGIGRAFTGIDKGAALSIETHLQFVDELPNPEGIKTQMLKLYRWMQDMQKAMIYLDGLSNDVKALYDAWQAAPGNFKVYFNEAIGGISRHFLGIDRASILAIEKHLEFIEDLPKPEEIKAQMVKLKNWLIEMQRVMIELDGVSLQVKAMYDKWQAAPGNFALYFNMAIDGICRNFNGINAASIQQIEKTMDQVEDGISTVKPIDVLITMLRLKWWLMDMGDVLAIMNESFNKSYRTLRKQIDKGMQFRDRLNEIMTGLKSIMDSLRTEMLQGLGSGFKSDFIADLPTTDQIWNTYCEVGWYVRRVAEIFPAMAQDAASLQKMVKPYLKKGDKFAQIFGEITNGLKAVMDKLTTEVLRNLGSGFKANVVDSLPNADNIWNAYCDVGWYVRRVSEVFPAMAQDAASLKQIVSGPLAQGERFAATFGEITGKLKSVMDQLSTELLKNLGNKFRGSVVDSLPSPQSIQETYREVSTYIRRVAMVFPQMALDARQLQRESRRDLDKGDEFAKTFGEIAGKVKGVMDQMSTELLKGLGGNWRRGVIAQLPTAGMIQSIWGDPDPRKGVRAYIVSIAAIFPGMAADLSSLEGEIQSQLGSGKRFGEALQRILGKMRLVFDNMNTGLLRGLGGRWQQNIVSKLPSPDDIKNSWTDIKAYIVNMAKIFPAMAADIATFEGSTMTDLDAGKNFGETLQRILGKMRMVFTNMNTGLLRGLGGRWQASVVRQLPTPDQIWATWNDPDPRKGVKAYLQSVAKLFPKLEADINAWKDSIATELESGGRFGASLTRIMERITGVFRSINTTLLRNMGPFGRDAKRGFVSQLPSPAQIENALGELEAWLTATARVISRNLPPMVTRLESTLTPEITATGVEAAEALGRMIGAVGSIFRRISVVNLKSAFAGFSKKTVNSLPNPDELLTTFSALEDWMKALVSKVLPKLTQLTADLKGALESQLNRGVAVSRDFGNMVQMIVDIFRNIRLTALSAAVRGFVRSWGRGLPPASELKDIMEQLVQWMQDIFGNNGPMKVMEEAMTNGPLSNISVIAEAIKEHAQTMAAAMASITDTFRAIDPSRAIRAIERLQRMGGRRMPSREEVVAAIERVQTFVADASAALHRGAEGVSGTERALGNGQAGATSFISTSASNADPSMATGGGAEMSVTRPSQNSSTVQTQIGQRLAGAEPPAGISAANQQLGEIAANTRQMAESQRETNRLLAAVLGSLSGGGGSSSGGSAASSGSNVQPTSTPLFPRIAFNYNGGAQKRYIQPGS